MRYEIGNMDRYNIAVNGTVMENASFFSATARENFQEKPLIEAVYEALKHHPLFKTRVRYKKQYYLETNDEPIAITHSAINDRPKQFGRSTNNYPWRLCYYDKTVCFEWCHVVSDGRGALGFFADILSAYFGLELGEVPTEFPLGLGFESFYDKSIKPLGQVKQAAGFKLRDFPAIENGFKCVSHILSADTKEVLTVAKKNDTTPAAILAPLLCKAVRARIPKDVRNRNVSCGIVVDCRKPADFPTMHNFILNKVITYTDRFDKYDLPTLGTIYRGILDLFTQKENIIAGCTDMIRQTDFAYRLRPLWLQRGVMKIVAKITKDTMNNIGLTYIGRAPFSAELSERLTDFGFRSWPDIGRCVAAVVDFKGRLYIDICENYKDKAVVDAFIEICGGYGLEVRKESEQIFEQAAMIV